MSYIVAQSVAAYGYGAGFAQSQLAGILVSAATVFSLNQLFTHRDKRLTGIRLASRSLLFALMTLAIVLGGIRMTSDTLSTLTAPQQVVSVVALLSTVASYSIARLLSRAKR